MLPPLALYSFPALYFSYVSLYLFLLFTCLSIPSLFPYRLSIPSLILYCLSLPFLFPDCLSIPSLLSYCLIIPFLLPNCLVFPCLLSYYLSIYFLVPYCLSIPTLFSYCLSLFLTFPSRFFCVSFVQLDSAPWETDTQHLLNSIQHSSTWDEDWRCIC